MGVYLLLFHGAIDFPIVDQLEALVNIGDSLQNLEKQQQVGLQEPPVILPSKIPPHLVQQQVVLFPEIQVVHLCHDEDEGFVVKEALVVSDVDMFGMVQLVEALFVLLVKFFLLHLLRWVALRCCFLVAEELCSVE